MKLPWIIAIGALAAAAYVLINSPDFQTAGGDPDLEEAATKTGVFGTEQRTKGTGGNLLGKLKEGVGSATGDKQLEGEGMVDQAVGTVKDTLGQAAHAVSDELHKAAQTN